MKVLVVAAHPDDEVLGCGGTMARNAIEGHEVTVLVCGSGRNEDAMVSAIKAGVALKVSRVVNLNMGLQDQRFDAVQRLDIIQILEKFLATLRPQVVYTHHGGDRNLDHRIIADAVQTACRPIPGQSVKNLLAFEIPSSTEWGDGFKPNVFIDITGVPALRKTAALNEYAAEMRADPHARSVMAISAREAVRGATVGVDAAEAFMLIREIR